MKENILKLLQSSNLDDIRIGLFLLGEEVDLIPQIFVEPYVEGTKKLRTNVAPLNPIIFKVKHLVFLLNGHQIAWASSQAYIEHWVRFARDYPTTFKLEIL